MRGLYVLLSTTLLLTTIISQGFSQENYPTSLVIEMHTIKEANAPKLRGDYVLLSYSSFDPTRRVGVAFEHENFTKIHPLSRNTHNVFILPYEVPEDVDKLVYRLVVDGIWIKDPSNPHTITTRQDVMLSYVNLPQSEGESKVMEMNEPGTYTFTFRSEDASRVAVAGSFNKWDPYMYRMKKVPGKDNLYSLSLSLPKGTHYYYFIVDGRRITDPDNPDKVVSSSGRTVSVIHISG